MNTIQCSKQMNKLSMKHPLMFKSYTLCLINDYGLEPVINSSMQLHIYIII